MNIPTQNKYAVVERASGKRTIRKPRRYRSSSDSSRNNIVSNKKNPSKRLRRIIVESSSSSDSESDEEKREYNFKDMDADDDVTTTDSSGNSSINSGDDADGIESDEMGSDEQDKDSQLVVDKYLWENHHIIDSILRGDKESGPLNQRVTATPGSPARCTPPVRNRAKESGPLNQRVTATPNSLAGCTPPVRNRAKESGPLNQRVTATPNSLASCTPPVRNRDKESGPLNQRVTATPGSLGSCTPPVWAIRSRPEIPVTPRRNNLADRNAMQREQIGCRRFSEDDMNKENDPHAASMKGLLKENQETLKLVFKVLGSNFGLPINNTDYPEFPIKELSVFQDWEKHLKESPQNFQAGFLHFSDVGGYGLDNSVRNLLAAIMSNTLAKQFSYCGQRKKRVFEGTKTNELVFKVAKRNCKEEFSRKKVIKIVQDWLKYAGKRKQD